MPLIEGIYGPVQKTAKQSVTSDQSLIIAAAAGRRYIGFSAKNTTAGTQCRGAIMQGASTVPGTTNVLDAFELGTNTESRAWNWPGIAAADGITIDWQIGTFDIVLYYVDAN